MRLDQELFGVRFQNPVVLAAGTCGFGEELADVMDLDSLGGLVTKSVTREPREGNPAPRVAEFGSGMLNSIGLANPGVEAVRRDKLPWLRDHLRQARVFVSVAGHDPEEFADVVGMIDDSDGFVGFEINLSCPNDSKRGALPFALDPEALVRVLERVRSRTQRPLWAKLAANAPDLSESARLAVEAGADGLTMVNTLPGLQFDIGTWAPRLGAGPGGMSGPALLPVGVHAVWRARRGASVPIVGAGGITSSEDALQYLLAGASLLEIGTASFADPGAAARVVDGLSRYGRSHGFPSLQAVIGGGKIQ